MSIAEMMQRCFGLESVAGGSVLAAIATMPMVLASCDRGPCDIERMTRLIHQQIREDNRSTDEYWMVPPRREGKLVYIAMDLKLAPLYRRHYLIDPATCTIVDLKIDQ